MRLGNMTTVAKGIEAISIHVDPSVEENYICIKVLLFLDL